MERVLPTTTKAISERQPLLPELNTTEGASGASLNALAHDARNLLAALGLYCDLLEEPQVLSPAYTHYAQDLRLVSAAMRGLVERLSTLDELPPHNLLPASSSPSFQKVPTGIVEDFAAEIKANRSLLAALVGPQIHIEVRTHGCALPVELTSEDVTRILVNLVRNAAEALPSGGNIWVEAEPSPSVTPCILLTVSDSGRGISPEAMPLLFEAGFSTRIGQNNQTSGWPSAHRGLGLSIVRSLAEGAGGSIHASNRPQGGACFVLDLPVVGRSRG